MLTERSAQEVKEQSRENEEVEDARDQRQRTLFVRFGGVVSGGRRGVTGLCPVLGSRRGRGSGVLARGGRWRLARGRSSWTGWLCSRFTAAGSSGGFDRRLGSRSRGSGRLRARSRGCGRRRGLDRCRRRLRRRLRLRPGGRRGRCGDASTDRYPERSHQLPALAQSFTSTPTTSGTSGVWAYSHGFRKPCDRGHVRRWTGSGTRLRR